MDIRFYYYCTKRDITNFSFLRHAKFSGFIVSMHQSGTHWLKHMLACAIAKQYSLPQPKYNTANDIISGHKSKKKNDKGPFLATSHTIPNPLFKHNLIRQFIKFPKYVILVRDIRSILTSNYMKWKDLYNCTFSEYIRNTDNKIYENQIWWCARFLNAWGQIAGKYPEETLVIKYEELCENPFLQLKKINNFLELHINDQPLLYGINESTKERMMKKNDPNNQVGYGVVGKHNMKPDDLFTIDDKKFFHDNLTRLCKYTFGYEY